MTNARSSSGNRDDASLSEEELARIRDPDETAVRAEIHARGPEALQAYKEALKSGQTKNTRVLVTVVGPARAGKTSLLRSLKGEKFNPNQDSTIGAHLQASFCKPQENAWCEDQTGKYNLFTSSLVKIIAKNLHTRTSEEHLAAASNSSTPLNLKDERDSRHKDLEGRTSQEIEEENETVQTTDVYGTVSKIPEELVGPLLNYLKGAKNDDRADENSIFLKTLDLAGQQVCEVLLPLFMSSKSIYILVYNLENDLLEYAQSKVKHGNSERELENHSEMTNLETLEFWLSCISSYTKKGGESVGGRTRVALPPVFVVCTHADKCKEDPKRLLVAETLVKHLTRPENPCGKHVMQNVYTVDNTLSGNREIKDKSAKRLKADIEELSKYLPQIDERVPLNWLKFEEELSNLVENEQKRYIDLEEARRIAKKCNINTAAESNELPTLLNYLHDLKSIIYFEETSTLFIDTQWLINMFVKVITVMPFEEWKDYADYWRKLEDEGVLQRALVEHVWKDIADDGQNTVDSLLLIMEKFSLICRWRLNDEEVFLVPCMLCNSERSEDNNVFLADPKSSTMIIRFKSVHLPLAIFPRLVVAVAEHAKKEWPKVNQPRLRPNFCRIFKVGEKGMLDICITSGIRIICVSVCNTNNLDDESVTHFCQSVRKLLAPIVDDMRRNLPSMENMEFEYGIRCPVCPTSRKKCKFHKMEGCTRDSCLHFVSEEELKNDHPKCYEFKTKSDDNLIKEEAYAHWFPKKTVSHDF